MKGLWSGPKKGNYDQVRTKEFSEWEIAFWWNSILSWTYNIFTHLVEFCYKYFHFILALNFNFFSSKLQWSTTPSMVSKEKNVTSIYFPKKFIILFNLTLKLQLAVSLLAIFTPRWANKPLYMFTSVLRYVLLTVTRCIVKDLRRRKRVKVEWGNTDLGQSKSQPWQFLQMEKSLHRLYRHFVPTDDF